MALLFPLLPPPLPPKVLPNTPPLGEGGGGVLVLKEGVVDLVYLEVEMVETGDGVRPSWFKNGDPSIPAT